MGDDKDTSTLITSSLLTTATAGPDGIATISVSAVIDTVPLLVRATLPGFVSSETLASVRGASADVLLALRRGANVRGQVVTPGGQPVPGVDVVALPRGTIYDGASRGAFLREGSPWLRTGTNAEGAFDLTLVKGLEYHIRLQAAGWLQVEPFFGAAPEDGSTITLVARPARVFRLRLVDKETSQPILKPHVTFSPSDTKARFVGYGMGRVLPTRVYDGREWRDTMGIESAVGNDAGVYEGLLWWDSEHDIPHKLELMVGNVIGYRSVVLAVTMQRIDGPPGFDSVALERLPGAPGVGTLLVTEDANISQQAPHAAIRLLRVPVGGEWGWDFIGGRRRPNGSWVFTNVPEGTWEVAVGRGGPMIWSFPARVTVQPQHESPLQVEYPDPSGIRVRATESDGTRLFGFDIVVHSFDSEKMEVGQQCGYYRAEDGLGFDEGQLLSLSPGSYRIGIVLPGYETTTKVVSLVTGQTAVVDVVLRQG